MLPCPFCGSNNLCVGDFGITCKECGTEVCAQRPNHDHKSLWNKRTNGKKDTCPFCGSNRIGLNITEADVGRVWLYCEDCYSTGPIGLNEDDAVELWCERWDYLPPFELDSVQALKWIWAHCKYHHVAKARGYVSRIKYANRPKIEAYKGRFGVGFKLITPRRDTTQYVNVCYYIF